MAYNQLLIAHIMSKIIFIKHSPLVRPNLVPKLKIKKFLEIWHIQCFKYANLDFDVKKIFAKYYHLLGLNWNM